MKIYNSKGSVLLDVEVDDSSVRYKAISGDNTVTLNFSLAEHVEIPIGSYCEFKNERYYLMSPENFTMRHRRYFEYSLLMFSAAANAKRYKFINPVDGRLKFPLTAKPVEHLQMIVDNMNLRDGEGSWKVGKCEDHVEIVLSYNHTFCHDALVQLANQLKLDYWYEGNTINVGKLELNKDNPLPLSYGGDGEGLKQDIKRTNYADALPVEVLYVQGSEKNIDPSKYGSSELHLPKGQTLQYDGNFFEDEDGFDLSKARTYIADDKGYSISRADKEISNHSEDSLDCTEIYPTKEETIESVIEVDKEKHFYDILFSSTVDYGQYLIEGEKATIVFQTGMLAGKEFDIATDEDGNLVCKKEGDYWRMEIVPQAIDGITMPDPESGYMPNANNEKDKFRVFNIQLPEEYVSHNSTKSGAEWEMFRYAVKHMYANEDAQYVIAGTLDEIYAKRNWDNISGRLKIGNYISFSDKSFQPEPLLIRITGIREYINKPYSPVLEISNAAPSGTVVGELDRIENQDALNEERAKSSRQYTDRRFRSSEETLAMLKSAFTNFSAGINPVTVNTIALLVGDESLQFKFTNSLSSLTDVECPLTYDNTTKQLAASSISYIKHMTLGVNAVSSSREASEFKGWRIPTFSGVLEDAEARYIYIKASKSSTTGAFVMSKTAIGMEDVSGYYHFLVGILNSEYNSSRDFVTLYGFTEVLPGQITTDVIRSGNGKLVIDLANALITAQSGATIIGNVTIGAGSSGLTNLSEWSDKQTQIDTASTSANEAKQVADKANASVVALGETVEGLDKTIEEINHKLDGVVESFFDDYTPSRTNEPAASWIVEGTEANHIGDTFTNTALEGEDAGKSWRWLEQSDGTYDWQQIADSDAAKALALAGQAQATADGKSTTFLVKPNRAYSKGDIWIVGEDYIPSGYEVGDILSATESSSTYIESHWSKVVRYTDDTAAEEAQSAAAKAQQKAEDAEEVAQNAKNALDGLLEDGLIQKFELQSFQSEYASINADKLTIDADVLRYGLSENAAYTSFSESFTSYNTTLENIIGATSYPIAVPSGLIANRNAYYGTRSDLLKVIAEAAKAVADEAKAAANDAQERAEQAAANAAAAQEKADSAEDIASSAKERIDKLIADAIITRSEADIFAIELRSIVAEKSAIDADVERYVLDSNASYTSYSGAYTNYYNILSTITNATEFPISAPDELVPYRNAYYGTRTSILNDIAAAAKRVADDAQDAADEANGTLAGWLVDGVITPVEKQSLRIELDRINEEHTTIIADAVRYGLDEQDYYDYDYFFGFYKTELERIIAATGTQDATLLSGYREDYYEKKSILLDSIETAAKSVVDGMAYLNETFGDGNNLNVTGAVLSQMVAVSNSAGEIEAFINGSDEGKDDTHGKLLIAAGIDDITTPETSQTRIYEDGTVITEKLNAKAGTIANLNITQDGLSQVDGDGRTVIELSTKSSIINSSPRYWGRLYEQAILSGSTDAADANAFFRISQKNAVEEDKIPDKTTILLIDLYDLETNQSGYAFAVSSGMFAGLRTNARVITSNGTATSRNTLSRYDFSVLVSATSGTYYIELPDEPLDGQEYVLESMGASMIVTSAKAMWSHYYGQSDTERTFTGSCSIRFKYYSEASMWTYSWLDWKQG